jgi:hypothetical protein
MTTADWACPRPNRNNAVRRLFVILVIVALAASRDDALALITLRVTADRVNLRARPSLQSEAIAQVGTGDTLQARQIGEEWVEVVPPPEVLFSCIAILCATAWSMWPALMCAPVPESTIRIWEP